MHSCSSKYARNFKTLSQIGEEFSVVGSRSMNKLCERHHVQSWGIMLLSSENRMIPASVVLFQYTRFTDIQTTDRIKVDAFDAYKSLKYLETLLQNLPRARLTS